MVDGQAGKGSIYRPYNTKAYDRGYLHIHGEPCTACDTKGYFEDKVPGMKKKVKTTCILCNGAGYKEKPKNERKQNV